MTSPRLTRYITGVRWLLPILTFVVLLGTAGVATSHDPVTAKTPEELRVFHFYATWYRPPERTFSCCNMQDCHVVQIRRQGQTFYFLDNIYQFGWREIPPGRLEQNTSDPRESPDGNSHVCFNGMYVLCAVLGSGQ